MLDNLISEVLNPGYGDLNIIDGLIDAKWTVLSYINSFFSQKMWKTNAGPLIHDLRSNKNKSFPKIELITPDGNVLKLSIKYSSMKNEITFELIMHTGAIREGVVTHIRSMSTSLFADKLFEEVNKIYNEIFPPDVGFGEEEGKYDKSFGILERMYPSIAIELERQNSIRFKFYSGNHALRFNAGGSDDIWGNIYNQIYKQCLSRWSDPEFDKISNSSRMFFFPEQKKDFEKLLKLVFNRKLFDKYLAKGFNLKKNFKVNVEYLPNYQSIRIIFYEDRRGDKMYDLIKDLPQSIVAKTSKYTTKYEVSGDELKKKLIIKQVMASRVNLDSLLEFLQLNSGVQF